MSQPQWGAAAVVAGSNASKRRAKTVMAGPHTVLDRVDVTVSRQDQQVLDTVMAALRGGGHATVVRVAGGWVRDKLLQRPNHDLDITVDDMTGAGVAGVVHDHLVAAGEAATRVAVIQANPEQSKHLETATTKVHGKEVDFVNLRCEEYAEDSRIPTTVREPAELAWRGQAHTFTPQGRARPPPLLGAEVRQPPGRRAAPGLHRECHVLQRQRRRD